MQAADVFEPWKMIGHTYTVSGDTDMEITPEYLTKCINLIREAGEQSGYIVASVSHSGHGTLPYINPKIKAVSSGKSWRLLTDLLDLYGVPHTTNDELFCFPQSIDG